MKLGILFNQVTESSTAALQALNANRMRTFLSTLGVTIGIFCIIMVLTIVESLKLIFKPVLKVWERMWFLLKNGLGSLGQIINGGNT
jgi:hypothetical protein